MKKEIEKAKKEHTPGPWKYNKGEPGYFPTVSIPWEHPELYPGIEDGITINAGNGPTERHEANARLIAAAPDLLAALERYVDDFARFESPAQLEKKPGHEMYQQALAAIAKAKGI